MPKRWVHWWVHWEILSRKLKLFQMDRDKVDSAPGHHFSVRQRSLSSARVRRSGRTFVTHAFQPTLMPAAVRRLLATFDYREEQEPYDFAVERSAGSLGRSELDRIATTAIPSGEKMTFDKRNGRRRLPSYLERDTFLFRSTI